MMRTTVDILRHISKQLEETNRCLRVIAARHEHRWTGPDIMGPMRCRECGEPY